MSPESQLNPYLVQKIMTASPDELVSIIYEAAIRACAQENHTKALESVQQLINALNFDEKEIASTFYKVYSGVLEHLYKRDYDTAREILTDLRKTWSQAMHIK